MRNKYNYDFHRAAVIIQAAVRGYLDRKLFCLAMDRAKLVFDEISNDMLAHCPNYQWSDGVDHISIQINGGSYDVVKLFDWAQPLYMFCSQKTPNYVNQPDHINDRMDLIELNEPESRLPVENAHSATPLASEPSTPSQTLSDPPHHQSNNIPSTDALSISIIPTSSPAPLPLVDQPMEETKQSPDPEDAAKMLTHLQKEKIWLERAIYQRIQVSLHTSPCILDVCPTNVILLSVLAISRLR